jgi:predicted chitinase
MPITESQLQEIMPKCKDPVLWAQALNPALEQFAINTPERIAAFLAQIAHESSQTTMLVEKLNYSQEGLMKTWPKRFPTPDIAATYARNPEKIANNVYANRIGNGDEASGDGWKYRGRGLKQLTGRANYREAGAALGLPLEEQPELLEQPQFAALSAAWFWQSKGLNELADGAAADPKKFEEITFKINGGYIGLAERKAFWETAKKTLGVAAPAPAATGGAAEGGVSFSAPFALAADNLLHFNGINGATGGYEMPPMDGAQLSSFIKGEAVPENLEELRFRAKLKDSQHFGVKHGVDPKKLEQTGWGVIFAHDENPAVIEALQPLLDLRKNQAGQYFKLFQGADGFRVGKDTKNDFLARHGAGPGPADPDKVPYYLLIVGSPEKIPYAFQYQVDVQYAVGRIHFNSLDEYANYAASVVAAETGKIALPRKIGLFGVANPGDRATELSAQSLITPLEKYLRKHAQGWDILAHSKDQASKAQLQQMLGGADTPALLFTASHGMAFPNGDPRQLPHQGALLCQDWPGPSWGGAIPQDFYLAGDDLDSDAKLAGLIAFHFACYGAGTPQYDDFAKQAFKRRETIAPRPFVAQLPNRMLSHPRGGALAAIGHVDRAWGYSFLWDKAGEQTEVFNSAIGQLLEGYPVGAALEFFNERYAELSSDLSSTLEEAEYGKAVDPYTLAGMWTANNDARSYVVIGDPAVRLPLAKPRAAGKRPALELRSTTPLFASTGEVSMQDPNLPAVAPAATAPGAVNYGLIDDTKEVLKNLGQKIAALVGDAVKDFSTLEIKTFTCDENAAPQYDSAQRAFTGAKLRAHTSIELDGDIISLVPTQPGPTGPVIDKDMLEYHAAMVREAQDKRMELLKFLAGQIGLKSDTSVPK